ncbi:hydantoinase B/oxoprolinase family protein [Prosthecomicrobium pneumaticum]|uniref:N-methylhydantoinase B n=1 Tax=Prosthecomicrobium pneumaticum TaxID=81895 RepID=A0A7W9CU01_9HYPH|nr:hydantoinase B/oxoprolinase family protein [Prosthecomicrobium pneumaticum]MBB5751624.1 N-methylhydantoinase B [Prosthecomicrobium pneumaticum]
MDKRSVVLSQVIGGSLNTIADEMSATVTRTARSPVFNEAHDFTTAIFEMNGLKSRLVAQSPGCTLHLYAVAMAVDRAIDAFKHDLQPGDVLLASDPYNGGTHIPDLVVVTPVFRDRKPVLFPAVRAHMGDVGGPVAGGYNPHARDVWQDGLVMPPVKIVERGERRTEMLDLLVANNRIAHWIEGDLASMIGACEMAGRRIEALLDRYGLDTVRDAIQANVDYSERRVRAEIASWPDGEYVGETFVDHDYQGQRDVRVVCKATVKGSDLTLDFTGSDPQTKGFINSPIANTLSFIFIALTTCCDEDIPINEGCMAPVTCIIPEGTVINPTRPAPVGTCTCSAGAEVTEAVLLALGRCAPERVGVNAHKMPLAFSYGSYDDGRMWVFLNFIGFTGGAGAAYETDGWGLYPPLMTGVILPSIEMTEIQYPSRVLKHEYVADMTGAGRWRGAPGLETVTQHLVPSLSSVMMEGVRHTAKGFAGGEHGAPNRVFLVESAAADAIDVPEYAFMHALPPGGMLRTVRGGGGGWGPAIERDPDAVREDVLDGYVTRDGALADYGVVLDAALELDRAATERERARRVAA